MAKVKNRAAETVASGGDTHQAAGGRHPAMTTSQGMPIADDQNSLKVGPTWSGIVGGFHPS
jgi:catalase